MRPIIKSMLDTDFYTFTMGQAVMHHYPDVWVKYRFKCRNFKETLIKMDQTELVDHVGLQMHYFCDLKFQDDEIEFLQMIPYFKEDYIARLEDFKPKQKYVTCEVVDGELYITIEGPWFETIWFEVPILSIVSELYSESTKVRPDDDLKKLKRDIKYIDHLPIGNGGFAFSDFGTRRRFSFDYQERVLRYIKFNHPARLFGTSNVYFAKLLGLRAMGTMSHQWLQAHQQITKVIHSQFAALDVWSREYRGDLGIALSDVVGFSAFLNDFDKYFAKLFDGCRHDSGEPIQWGDKLISHYKGFDIDPRTKTGLFSDGLDFPLMAKLYTNFRERILTAYGIGTELTGRPWEDYIAPQIVIKMVECNEAPVAKVSDSKGKGMCEDEGYYCYIKRVFDIED